jgi:hypothetical protein
VKNLVATGIARPAVLRWTGAGGAAVYRNRGRKRVPQRVVADIVSDTISRLTLRHPSFADTVVNAVVYEAVSELVTTVTEPDQLRQMSTRRAHARLTATSGRPMAINPVRDQVRDRTRSRRHE